MVAELSPNALRVLEVRYLRRDLAGRSIETPAQLFERVARAVSEAELVHGTAADARFWEARFHAMLASLDFLPNSPTLMNAGTPLGQLSACFVLPVDDTMESIFGTLRDMALVQRTGGGTGFSFSRLRPAGDRLGSTGGTASGPLSFMQIYDCATENVKLGGRRRGANMGVLRVDHPDIAAFIAAKRDGALRNFNISVAITDAFIAAVDAGSDAPLLHPRDGREVGRRSARALFAAICEAAWATGDPGLLFLDTIARGNPTPALGAIESTNPCVTGDTLVYTDSGLRRADELATACVPVRVVTEDAGLVQASPVFRTGRKLVYRLETREGYTLRLTRDHRLLTRRGWVAAQDLGPGDEVRILSHEGGFGTGGSLALGRVLGWLVGDGTFDPVDQRAVLSFYAGDRPLAPTFAAMVKELVAQVAPLGTRRRYSLGVTEGERANVSTVRSTRLARLLAEHGVRRGDKLKAPESVLTGNRAMQRGFLQALFTADGHVAGTQSNGISVRLTSTSLGLLQNVQHLLLNFGIASVIYRERRQPGLRPMPDGHGEFAAHWTRAYHDLVISKENLHRFASEIGFLRKDKQSTLRSRITQYTRGPYGETFFARFLSLTADGEEDVYDLTEPHTSSFVANGMVVHNCGELPLLPYEACNLGSINLAHLVREDDGGPHLDWERLRALVHDAVRFLDDVITVNRYPLAEVASVTLGNRKIGLGVMGFAELLIGLGVSYVDEEAVRVAADLMGFVAAEARAASAWLAEERGVFPNWERSVYAGGPRLRNAALLSVAPTGTISIIADTSSSIEPLFALAYRRHALDGQVLTEWNPLVLRYLERRGLATDEVLTAVARSGRLTGVPGVPGDLCRLFATALDVPAEQHVRVQAAFQRHVDNAVSKTINLPHEATPADIAAAYRLAHRLGCKGVTVYRYGATAERVLELGADEPAYAREHFARCDPGACRL